MWKALRIADSTRLLPEDAAAFVDRQLAPYAHGCSWAQVDRLVDEALVRFDPAAAEERRRDARDHRHVDLGLDQVGYDGIAHGTTALDIADALDLEQAIARRAKLNGQLGDTDSLEVRRAKALGEIAREDLILDLDVADPDTGEITRTVPGRKTELILHLSATDQTVGRFGNTRTPIAVEQIKRGSASRTLGDRPAGPRPGRPPAGGLLRDPRPDPPPGPELRDHHCVFPHCTRPAERCDLDHIEPHADSGVTCPCNLAPLCRGHHRLKTAGRPPTGCSPPAPTTGPCRRGPTWSTPPAPTSSLGRQHPTRPRSSYPAPHPATGGATGMPRGGFEAPRCAPRTSTSSSARTRLPTATTRRTSRDRNHSEHPRQRRARAGPGEQRRNQQRRATTSLVNRGPSPPRTASRRQRGLVTVAERPPRPAVVAASVDRWWLRPPRPTVVAASSTSGGGDLLDRRNE